MGQGTESCGGYEIDFDPYEDNLCSGMWIQADGSEIGISDMSDRHLRNAIRRCNQLARTSSFSCESDKWLEWADIMRDELLNRELSSKSVKSASQSLPKSVTTFVIQKSTRGAKVEKTCKCGNKFKARVADVKRGWAKSCSKSCAAKFRK